MKPGKLPTVAVVFTIRSHSQRLENKNFTEVLGKPLAYWCIQKLKEIGHVIVACPKGDTQIVEWAKLEELDVFEGSENDVTARIMGAVKEFQPDAKYIMRGLGDCPFIEPELAKRAVSVLHNNDGDAFVWALSPFNNPVYGCSEFPRSRKVWDETDKKGRNDEREHPDLYYHRNRGNFKIIYHDPPPPIYFRPYRLEVDWKEDMELIRRIAKHFNRIPTTKEAIEFLDKSEDWKINAFRTEKTGLMVSYTQEKRNLWWRLMQGQPIAMWDDSCYNVPISGTPIYCRKGCCLLGHSVNNKLYRVNGEVITAGRVNCQCGTGRTWAAK